MALYKWSCGERVCKCFEAGAPDYLCICKKAPESAVCVTCGARLSMEERIRSNLEAAIEQQDAEAKKAEPDPARVLPGQRRLFE